LAAATNCEKPKKLNAKKAIANQRYKHKNPALAGSRYLLLQAN